MLHITADDIKKIAPSCDPVLVNSLRGPLNQWLPAYQINTVKRISRFLGQGAIESAYFRTLHEYASGKAYEGRKDLGNIYKGDGVRYKGRGIFQLTGRANYTSYGQALGLDLVNNPELAADPEVSVRIACEYWKRKGLNGWADRCDDREITRRINGGETHLAERVKATKIAEKVLSAKVTEVPSEDPVPFPAPKPKPVPAPEPELPDPPPPTPPAIIEETPDAPIAAEPSKPWYKSTEQMTGASIAVTGVLAALKDFATSPWGFAMIVFLVLAGGGAYIVWRRRQRDKKYRPVIPEKDLL